MSDKVVVTRPDAPGMISIRADLGDAGLVEAVAAATGVAVPAVRRRAVSEDGATALWWMSPDELLLVLPRAAVAGTLAALEAGFDSRFAAAVDLSDARALFVLEGPGAREVLAKGAPVDLSPAAFGPGDLRRTRLGQVAAAFAMTSDAPERFELVCFRSVSHHVETWARLAATPGTLPGVF